MPTWPFSTLFVSFCCLFLPSAVFGQYGGYGSSMTSVDDPTAEVNFVAANHPQHQRSLVNPVDSFGRLPPVPSALINGKTAAIVYPQEILGLGQSAATSSNTKGQFSPVLPPTKDLYFPPPEIPRGPPNPLAPIVVPEPSSDKNHIPPIAAAAADAPSQLVVESPSQLNSSSQRHIPVAIASPPRIKFTITNLGSNPIPPIPGFGPLAYSRRPQFPTPAPIIIGQFGGPDNLIDEKKAAQSQVDLEKRSGEEYAEEVSNVAKEQQPSKSCETPQIPAAAATAGPIQPEEKRPPPPQPQPSAAAVGGGGGEQAEVQPAAVETSYGQPQPNAVANQEVGGSSPSPPERQPVAAPSAELPTPSPPPPAAGPTPPITAAPPSESAAASAAAVGGYEVPPASPPVSIAAESSSSAASSTPSQVPTIGSPLMAFVSTNGQTSQPSSVGQQTGGDAAPSNLAPSSGAAPASAPNSTPSAIGAPSEIPQPSPASSFGGPHISILIPSAEASAPSHNGGGSQAQVPPAPAGLGPDYGEETSDLGPKNAIASSPSSPSPPPSQPAQSAVTASIAAQSIASSPAAPQPSNAAAVPSAGPSSAETKGGGGYEQETAPAPAPSQSSGQSASATTPTATAAPSVAPAESSIQPKGPSEAIPSAPAAAAASQNGYDIEVPPPSTSAQSSPPPTPVRPAAEAPKESIPTISAYDEEEVPKSGGAGEKLQVPVKAATYEQELAATEYGEPASSAAETFKSISIASSTQSSSSPSPSPSSTPSQANYEGNANFQEVGDNDQQQRGESPIQPSAIPNNLHENSVKTDYSDEANGHPSPPPSPPPPPPPPPPPSIATTRRPPIVRPAAQTPRPKNKPASGRRPAPAPLPKVGKPPKQPQPRPNPSRIQVAPAPLHPPPPPPPPRPSPPQQILPYQPSRNVPPPPLPLPPPPPPPQQQQNYYQPQPQPEQQEYHQPQQQQEGGECCSSNNAQQREQCCTNNGGNGNCCGGSSYSSYNGGGDNGGGGGGICCQPNYNNNNGGCCGGNWFGQNGGLCFPVNYNSCQQQQQNCYPCPQQQQQQQCSQGCWPCSSAGSQCGQQCGGSSFCPSSCQSACCCPSGGASGYCGRTRRSREIMQKLGLCLQR